MVSIRFRVSLKPARLHSKIIFVQLCLPNVMQMDSCLRYHRCVLFVTILFPYVHLYRVFRLPVRHFVLQQLEHLLLELHLPDFHQPGRLLRQELQQDLQQGQRHHQRDLPQDLPQDQQQDQQRDQQRDLQQDLLQDLLQDLPQELQQDLVLVV